MALQNWLGRMLKDDRAYRYPGTGILAYFWDGSAPAGHTIKDLSSTGAYIYATERWFTGTILDISFRDKPEPKASEVLTFTVQCRVVRHGPDGMGVAFMPRSPEQQEAVRKLLGPLSRKRAMWAVGKTVYSAS